MRKFQPERYKLWKAGKDSTIIDHTLPTPEAAEFLKESELVPRAQKEEDCPEEETEGLEDGEEGSPEEEVTPALGPSCLGGVGWSRGPAW